jgi:hypothetical protein
VNDVAIAGAADTTESGQAPWSRSFGAGEGR